MATPLRALVIHALLSTRQRVVECVPRRRLARRRARTEKLPIPIRSQACAKNFIRGSTLALARSPLGATPQVLRGVPWDFGVEVTDECAPSPLFMARSGSRHPRVYLLPAVGGLTCPLWPTSLLDYGDQIGSDGGCPERVASVSSNNRVYVESGLKVETLSSTALFSPRCRSNRSNKSSPIELRLQHRLLYRGRRSHG
jgi:hypothetical protein